MNLVMDKCLKLEELIFEEDKENKMNSRREGIKLKNNVMELQPVELRKKNATCC
jgi:hypothetical protein